VIPGSHNLALEPGCFDAAMFLRPDLPDNKKLIQAAKRVELHRGDVLFFHSKLFHAAGRNLSDEVKYSLVFTYHQSVNKPIKDTRSAKFPGISL
jgi:phytanoyl-CoA hydroxylase